MIADTLATVLFDGSHPRDPGLARLLGLERPAMSGANVDHRTVLGLSPIYRGVNIVGNAVAKCTPHIYRRLEGGNGGDKERDRKHPAWRGVVNWANPWMSSAELRNTLTKWAILRGNGIAHVLRNADGVPIEYTPLLPDRTGMAIFGAKVTEDSPIPEEAETMYWTMVGGQMRTILPENILHIPGHTNNGIWGVDIIELMRETLGLAIAARDCGARFYGHGMLQSGILYMPPNMGTGPKGEETVNNFIKSVKEQAQGLGRSHRMLVIDEGAKYEKTSVDPEGAQALQTREFEIEELANVVGCQAHKLGSKKRASYASLEQANQEHLDDDIDPWLRRWEEALGRTALRDEELENDTHFIQCNRKALMRTNLQARSMHYGSGRQWGYYSVNDVRRAEDLDPIGPEGDIYLIPQNMMPADQAGENVDGIVKADDVEPVDDDAVDSEKAQLAADLRSLATHECGRLVTRVCEEAIRKSAKGGADFVAFVESIDSRCQEPAPLRSLLKQIGGHLAEKLNVFTEPPYAAADLKTNVATAIDGIRSSATALGYELLDADAQRKAAA